VAGKNFKPAYELKENRILEVMERLSQIYRLKGNVGPPERYLGSIVETVQLKDGTTAWSLSCHDYLVNAIQKAGRELREGVWH